MSFSKQPFCQVSRGIANKIVTSFIKTNEASLAIRLLRPKERLAPMPLSRQKGILLITNVLMILYLWYISRNESM